MVQINLHFQTIMSARARDLIQVKQTKNTAKEKGL